MNTLLLLLVAITSSFSPSRDHSSEALKEWKAFGNDYHLSVSSKSVTETGQGDFFLEFRSYGQKFIRIETNGLHASDPEKSTAIILNPDYGCYLNKESEGEWSISKLVKASGTQYLESLDLQSDSMLRIGNSPVALLSISFEDLWQSQGFSLKSTKEMSGGYVAFEFEYESVANPDSPSLSDGLRRGTITVDPSNRYLPIKCEYVVEQAPRPSVSAVVEYDYGAADMNAILGCKLPNKVVRKMIYSPTFSDTTESKMTWKVSEGHDQVDYRLPSFGIPEPEWLKQKGLPFVWYLVIGSMFAVFAGAFLLRYWK